MKTRKKVESRNAYRKAECVKLIYNDILNLAGYNTIKKKVMEDEYGLGYKYSKGCFDDMYSLAMDEIREDYKKQKENINEKLVAVINDIAYEARENGDSRSALKGVELLMKIFNVAQDNNKKTVEVQTPSSTVKIKFGFGDEEESKEEDEED